MAFPSPIRNVRTETMWYILSAVFFTIGIVGALGEWVFHWWEDPWEWASPMSLVLGALTFVWGASARDVRGLREGLHGFREEQRSFREEQRSFRGELRAFRQEMRAGQARTEAVLGDLKAGQAEQTALLREVVASFRRT